MASRSSALLALIHQHLVQSGYAKAARELQIESGEKFISQNVSLKAIFKHWKQKNKKSKRNEAPSKKPRVQDPAASCESSDNKGKAPPKGAALLAQSKKGSAKKPAKVRPESAAPKKMKPAKKSSTKVKGAVHTETTALKDKPVPTETPAALAKSSDDSDSEEETVPPKAAAVPEPIMKSPPAADLKSKTSSITDPAKRDKSAAAKPTPTASIKKHLVASNGKAAIIKEIGKGSESSDETDIEKHPAVVTPAPSSVKASKGAKPAPSNPVHPKTDSTSESSESESEEEQEKLVPTRAAPLPKVAKTAAAQMTAAKGKSVTKVIAQTPVPKAAPAMAEEDESSEESDSHNKLMPTTPKHATSASVPASKLKLQSRHSVPQPKADDSSSSEEESEEEPVRTKMPEVTAAQDKVDPPATEAVTVSQAKAATSDGNDGSADPVVTVKPGNGASLGKPPSPSKAGESETSDSSDSEKEPEIQKTAASPKKGANTTGAQASKPNTVVLVEVESSGTSDDSDSEPEMKAPEKSATSVASNLRTPVPSTKQTVATSLKAKPVTLLPAPADETSDDSDSEEEPETKKTGSQIQTPNVKTPPKTPSTGATTRKTGTTVQTVAPVADSSDSEVSDSDEELEFTVVTPKTGSQLQASNVKTPSRTPAGAAAAKTATPVQTVAAADSSDSDDSASDDEPVVTKITTPLPASGVKTPSTAAKQPVTPNAAVGRAGSLQKPTADDSSETDETDSDEDEEVEQKTAGPLQTSSVKTPSAGAKQPAAVAAAAKSKTPLPQDDSSETDDSDAYEPVKTLTPAIGGAKAKPLAKSTALTPAAQGKAAKTVSEMVVEESSEDSESEEEPGPAVKAPGPPPGTPALKPATAPPAQDADSESSDASDSEEETVKKPAVAVPSKAKPALAAKEKEENSASSEEESDSEDSDTQAKEPVKSSIPQTLKSKGTAAASLNKTAATPSAARLGATQEKTPAAGKTTTVQLSSESSDSSEEDLPPAQALLSSLTPKQRPNKLSLQPEVAAKSKAPSPAKTVAGTKPAAESSDSSEASDSEEETQAKTQKPEVTALAKHKTSTPTFLLKSTPSLASPAKGKVGLPAKSPKAAKTMQVSAAERDGKQSKQVATPAPTPKALAKKGTETVTKTPKATKVETVKPASLGKAAAAQRQATTKSSQSSENASSDEKSATCAKLVSVQTKLESFFAITPAKEKAKSASLQPTSSSETSGGDKEPVVKAMKAAAAAAPATPKTPSKKASGKAVKPLSSLKTKDIGPTKTPAPSKQAAAESSSESSDTEDDIIRKKKLAQLGLGPSVAGVIGHRVLGGAPSASTAAGKGDADDSITSEQEESQSILQSSKTPSSTKRKLALNQEGKEHNGKPSKKKSKVQAAPTQVAPTTPGALLESEEETVLALLEGRSPKKAKKALKSAAAGTQTIQTSFVLKSSPPHTPSEDKKAKKLDIPSPAVPELGQLSKKKPRAEKRKIPAEDGEAEQKDKTAKKAKKAKAAIVAEEATSPAPSKKEKKSPKDKKKKKDKQKESKKLAGQIPVAPIVAESTDSGIGLQSKPKKKKKVKGDK